MINWKLFFYPAHTDAVDPGSAEKRKTDGDFLLACDAICKNCTHIQHPPQGGECPRCGAEGAIDYQKIERG
jgi:hypothetical protein